MQAHKVKLILRSSWSESLSHLDVFLSMRSNYERFRSDYQG